MKFRVTFKPTGTITELDFKIEQSGQEIVQEIINYIQKHSANAKHPISATPSDYYLFHSKSAQWLRLDQTLPVAVVHENDLLELKQKQDCAEIGFAVNDGSSALSKEEVKPILVDLSDTLRKVIPQLVRVYPQLGKGKEEYCFRKFRFNQNDRVEALRFLNSNIPLNEQSIKANGSIVLLPLSIFFEKPLDQFTIEDMIKSGWLHKNSQKGDAKPTGMKKRWCVLSDHFLFYFADNKGSAKPNGVVNLEHCMITHEGNNIRLKTCETSFKNLAITYNFYADDEAETKEWASAIRFHCVNGDHNRVFGVSVVKEFAKGKDNICAPLIKCINYIDAKALDKEKIFQIKGQLNTLNSLREQFDQGVDVNMNDVDDPYVVAELLKIYLRDLPEPVITFDLYEAFLHAKPEITLYNELISKLPIPHQVVLEILAHFLARLLSHKMKNSLDMDTLVYLFGQSILRPREPLSPEAFMRVTPDITNFMKFLVGCRHYLIFKHPPSDKTHEWKLKLKNESHVKALYDYNSRGQKNAQGEVDLSFKKEDIMQVLDERGGNAWMKVKFNKIEGLVPKNYVTPIELGGEISIKRKKKKEKSKKKSTLKPKRTSSKTSLRQSSDSPNLLRQSFDSPSNERENEEIVQLQRKLETETKLRIEVEEALDRLKAEFEDYKRKHPAQGPTNEFFTDLPPPPSDDVLPPPPLDLPPPIL